MRFCSLGGDFEEFQAKKILCRSKGSLYGRGGETRTRDTRFWRPVLYQLSYAPKERLLLSPLIKQA